MKEQIEEKHALSESIYMSGHGLDWRDSDDIAEQLYTEGYRKQSEGEWKDQYQGMYANQLYKCSVCGETAFHDDKRWFLTNFCPNCGAKMKGGAE